MAEFTVERRSALKRLAAVVGAIGALFGLGHLGSRPAAAIETDDRFVADDVRVERNDGELRAVTVRPELDVVWADFGDGIDAIDATVSAALDGEPGFDVLFDGPVAADGVAVDGDPLDGTDGSVTLSFDPIDLTAAGSNVTTADFGGDLPPGESRTTGVELSLRVDIVGAQDETVTTVETAAFDVTVHNPEGEATATGRANTDAE